jgi:hypothetical protein
MLTRTRRLPDVEQPIRVSTRLPLHFGVAGLMLSAACVWVGCKDTGAPVSNATGGAGGSLVGPDGSPVGTGGITATGGLSGTGGQSGSGGTAGTGGVTATSAQTGGAIGTGGLLGTGGATGGATGANPRSFVHPGILHTRAEIDRMIAKVNAGAQPWKGGWDKLVANPFSQTTYTPNPQPQVCAGTGGCPDGETFMPLARDCAAAYQNALRYSISGDTKHADAAIAILNVWSTTLQAITGDSNAGLRAGLYGYQLAAAAELVRDYGGWATDDMARFKTMLLTKFYPISSDFLVRHNNTCFDHYWANWDLANMATIIAIGVFTDDRAKFDEAVSYFKTGVGTGQVDRMVPFLYPGSPVLGQGQEAGRDQGHATLDISLVGAYAKIAFDQGEDLFAYQDSKILALAEYTAKYNLGEDVPWTNYTNCEANAMTAVSASSRGTERPSWELLYNHYVKLKGLSAPNSQRFAERLRPEGGGGDYGTNSGGFDQLGFGTLTFFQ